MSKSNIAICFISISLSTLSAFADIGVMRHGDRADSYKGYRPRSGEQWGNCKLSKKGMREVRDAARNMIEVGFMPSKIYTSPYLRTRQTAQLVAHIMEEETGKSVQVIIEHAIQETPSSLALARAGHEHEATVILPTEGFLHRKLPMTGTDQDWERGVRRFFDFLVEQDPAEDVLVVSHGYTVRDMARYAGIGNAEHTETAGYFIIKKSNGNWRKIHSESIPSMDEL